VDIMTLLILARGVDYYVGVSVFSEVAERAPPSLSLSLSLSLFLSLSAVVRGIGDVDANSKQEPVIGRFGHFVARW